MKKALLYLLIFFIIQGAMTFLTQCGARLLGGSQQAADAKTVIIASILSSVVTIAVFIACRWTPVFRDYLRSHPWGVLLWSAVAACGTIIPSEYLQEQLPVLPNWLEDTFTSILKDRLGYLALGLLAPVAEEFVFRGGILRVLLGSFRRPWAAICTSALLFAVAHINPAQLPHAFLAGLLLGWMYYRTGSILPGIVFHWVNNTIAYVVYNLIPNADEAKLSDIFGGDHLRLLLAVLFSLCILLPALFQLHLRMKKA